MNKPDFRNTSAQKKALLARDKSLKNIIDSGDLLSKEAAAAMEDLRRENAYKTLNETPLSALNASKQGIRVSALSNAGFSNIGELLSLSLTEIDSIKGIGTGSAEVIKKTLEDIEKTVYENSKAKLTADSKSPETLRAVTALSKLIHGREIRKSAATLYSSRHREISTASEKASKITNTFFWIFSGKGKKEETLKGTELIQNLYAGSFISDADRIISDHESVINISPESAWQDFISRSAFYYTALEELSEKYSSLKDIAESRDRIRSDVPEELAELINSRVLKLDGFKTALRSYQTFGAKYALYQEKTLLGDEMGLGKTVQALASLQSLFNEGKRHFIVICPASVLINWVRETGTFSNITPLLIRDEKTAENSLKWLSDGGIAIVNYEAVPKFRDLLPEDFKSDMTVVDEAHYIKNPEARRTAAAKEILDHSDRVLLMSGTPLENRIEEMKNLIGFLNTEVARKIRMTEDSWSGEGFRKKIAPVYLRRTREDVLSELPDLIEKDEICPVNKAEKEAYDKDKKAEDFMGMRQVSFKNVEPGDSSKLKRILEICGTAGEQGRRVIIFSFFKNTLKTVKEALGDRGTEIIDGSMSSERRQEILDGFAKSEPGTALIAQIIAGGTGLNIQSASVVILCEPQIKPSLETQAISRAYRMGQLHSVLVYRMISDDTIDEEILDMLKNKQDIFDKFADESEMAEAAVSDRQRP